MKLRLFVCGFLMILFCSFSLSSQAQFLKKLGDAVTNRVENKVINDAGDQAVKGVDKAEHGTAKAVKGDGKKDRSKASDESTQDAQQQQSIPSYTPSSNTSSSSLPDDYKLTLTGSGNGLHLQYQMEMNTNASSGMQMNITSDMYADPNKGGRSEVSMDMPIIGNRTMVMLTNVKKPNQVIILDEKKKKYSILETDEEDAEGTGDQFKIEKLGTETVHGLSCVHGKATSENGESFEFWTTKQVPGYQKMLALYAKSGKMGSDGMWKAMQESGTAGLLVKLYMPTPQGEMTMLLTKMEKTTVPQSMLEIPNGYKKSNGKWAKRYLNQGK